MSDSRIINLPTASEVPDTAYLMIDSAVDVEDENTGARKVLVSKMETVKQVNTTEYSSLRVLLSNSDDNNTETESVKKSGKLRFNPSDGTLYVGRIFVGNVDTDLVEVATQRYVDNAGRIFLSTDNPSNELGNNGDLYIKYAFIGDAVSTTLFEGNQLIFDLMTYMTGINVSDDCYNYERLKLRIRCVTKDSPQTEEWVDVHFNAKEIGDRSKYYYSDDVLPGATIYAQRANAGQIIVGLSGVSGAYNYYVESVTGIAQDKQVQSMYSKITGSWEQISIGGGGGTGNVADVYVNGQTVLDNNHIAQIKTHKEVTQAEYDALPSSKLTDGIMYCITDSDAPAGSKLYLKSHGTEYIMTDIIAKQNINFELTFFFDYDQLVGNSWGDFFGGMNSNVNKSIDFGYNDSSGTITFQRGTAYNDSTKYFSPNVEYKVTSYRGRNFIDGVSNSNLSISTFTSDYAISIFARNQRGSIVKNLAYNLLRLRFYEDTTLIADFVPSMNNGEPCLYDKVSRQYYTNRGTGNFEIGVFDHN